MSRRLLELLPLIGGILGKAEGAMGRVLFDFITLFDGLDETATGIDVGVVLDFDDDVGNAAVVELIGSFGQLEFPSRDSSSAFKG